MTVFALWSAARSRSTAFFRSMLERSDLLALHEPLEGLVYIGPVEIASRRFDAAQSLIDWLLDEAPSHVFLKETMTPPVAELVRSNRRFLSEVRHAFLIRRPEEIAASFLALEGDLRIHETGVEALHDMYMAVRDAGGRPTVIDSDELLAAPEATMRAYCDAVGLPFVADALTWQPGVRAEWERTARWHEEASASAGFLPPLTRDRHGLESHPEVVRFAAHHQPFYERLRGARLRIDVPEP